jgi:hypothetical protein
MTKMKLKRGLAIDEFLPFIRFLYDRREKVYQLLDGVKEDGKIPRYAIPGWQDQSNLHER